jgi:hypothetical protein
LFDYLARRAFGVTHQDSIIAVNQYSCVKHVEALFGRDEHYQVAGPHSMFDSCKPALGETAKCHPPWLQALNDVQRARPGNRIAASGQILE